MYKKLLFYTLVKIWDLRYYFYIIHFGKTACYEKPKIIALLLSALVLLTSFSGCADEYISGVKDILDSKSYNKSEPISSESKTEPKTESKDSGSKKDRPAARAEVDIEEAVVFDQNGIVITALSLTEGDFFGPTINFLIENNSEEDIIVSVDDLSINGIMLISIMSTDVIAGKKANAELSISSTNLETAGIEIIKDIEFEFHIVNPKTWETMFNSDNIKLATTADPSFVQTIDDSGDVLLEQDGIEIVLKNLDTESGFSFTDIYFYIENNSGKDVTIQARDTSVNDFMIIGLISSNVPAGKKAFDKISFSNSQLEKNGIEEIKKIELKFHVFESDTFDNIFDSDNITITF